MTDGRLLSFPAAATIRVPAASARRAACSKTVPARSWDWSNLLIGRRTDAFVRELARLAADTGTRAFAFGALSGYGANASGSAYLDTVVGGPRRAHRFRDRLARNAVGTWLLAHHPTIPSPSDLAASIRFGAPTRPSLPPRLEQLVLDALAGTFDLSADPPVPDLQRGYRRLVRHLELLDAFVRPAVPSPPSGAWAAAIYADPANPPPTLRTQDIGLGGDPGGGVSLGNNQPGGSQPSNGDSDAIGTICGIIVAILIVIDVVQAFVQCCVQWADGETCTFWVPHDVPPGLVERAVEVAFPGARTEISETDLLSSGAQHAGRLEACELGFAEPAWFPFGGGTGDESLGGRARGADRSR